MIGEIKHPYNVKVTATDYFQVARRKKLNREIILLLF